MKYKPEWWGHLKIRFNGDVFWDSKVIGKIVCVTKEGARSPGGMLTNAVFTADGREFASKTLAIEHLVATKT